MADGSKKKTVLMFNDKGEEYDVPEENVQAFIEAGGKLASTTQPPSVQKPSYQQKPQDYTTPLESRQDLLDLPGAMLGKMKELGAEYIQAPIKAAVGDPFQTVSNFFTSAGARVASLPGRMATVVGKDPSKITAPYMPTAELTAATLFGPVAYPFTVQKRETKALMEGKMPPPPSGDVYLQKDVSLKDAGKAPEGPGSTAGQMFMDGLELFLAKGAIGKALTGAGGAAYGLGTSAKAPAIIKQAMPYLRQAYQKGATSVEGNRFLSWMANLVADGALNTAQEFSNSGDTEKAIDAAKYGLLADTGLRSLGGILTRTSRYMAAKALPLVEKLGDKMRDVVSYHEELVNEMLKKNIRFTRSGAEKLSASANSATQAMKKASSDADEVLNDFAQYGVLPAGAQNDFINVDDIFQRSINKMIAKYTGDTRREQIGPAIAAIKKQMQNVPILDKDGNQLTDAAGNLLYEDLSSLRYSFNNAEKLKTLFNDQLRTYINAPGAGAFENVVKEVKQDLLEATRTAIQEGFDRVRKLKEANLSALPAGSRARELNPWDINIPGEKPNLTYQEAGQVAKKTVDLATLAWDAIGQMTTQADRSFVNQGAAAIAASQAYAGSFMTPSQFATFWRVSQSPKWSPSIARGAAKVSTLAGKRTPMTLKRGAASSLARQQEEKQTEVPPISPSAQRLLEDFSKPLNQ